MIKLQKESIQIVLLVLLLTLFPISGYTLERLPDVGIDYRTMTVNQPAKLSVAGMRDVRNGDKISMRVNDEGVRYFKNLRTNEELAYPPVQSKEKKNQ